MSLARTACFFERIEVLHNRLLNSEVVNQWLTAAEISINGKKLNSSDTIKLPFVSLSILEFSHLFAVFNGSRVHAQMEKKYGPDGAPPGFYFTIINNKIIQNKHKNKLGVYERQDEKPELYINDMHVDHFFLNEHMAPSLLGTFAFTLCAINAHRTGIGKITLIAAGAGKDADTGNKRYTQNYIGYKVWPKLGFNAPIDEAETRDYAHLITCNSVQDVLHTDAAWWEAKGFQRLMGFDLTATSRSWEKLLSYVERKLNKPDKNQT